MYLSTSCSAHHRRDAAQATAGIYLSLPQFLCLTPLEIPLTFLSITLSIWILYRKLTLGYVHIPGLATAPPPSSLDNFLSSLQNITLIHDTVAYTYRSIIGNKSLNPHRNQEIFKLLFYESNCHHSQPCEYSNTCAIRSGVYLVRYVITCTYTARGNNISTV